ncbi:MAG: hypothetical protein K8S87_05380 [Planctomycetes bacterium]|nr:hypothetical protein [Planctomycetota bacterium]
MKNSVFIVCAALTAILLINLANTQSNNKIRFQIAKPAFKAILPQTHAKLSLSKSFMDFWLNVKSDDQDPRAITFMQISDSEDKARLKIHDYTDNATSAIVEKIKTSLNATGFKLNKEETLTLDNKQINSLFFQDSKQNVHAFYVFKVGNSVFSVELISKYASYASVDKYWYEILNKIKVPEKSVTGYDKILLSKYATVLMPSTMKYNLPVIDSVFVGKLDSLKVQCYVYNSRKSTRKIANDIESKMVDRLGFRRINGNTAHADEVETVDFYGNFTKSRNLNLHVWAKRDIRVIMIFEYEKSDKEHKILTDIKQSIEFSQKTENPDSFIPFAFMVDDNNDDVPDYFTVNMIFLTKNKEILADVLPDSTITMKIHDQNSKMVFKSEPFKINSPRDCLPDGIYSEYLRFDGLWLAKIKDINYKFQISVLFKNKKLEYSGSLTDLIFR